MDERASPGYTDKVLLRDVRAPRWVTCVPFRRGALVSVALMPG
jgi:hypothetical protein